MTGKKAFTLIELLIVVAIIAILAAIAVPNFLEAQTRSKVSRTLADLRTVATAIEAYTVDYNVPPIDGAKANDNQAFWYVPGGPTVVGGVAGISSPIAYITSARLIDPFRQVIEAANAKALDVPDSNYFTVEDYRRFRYRNFKYTYSATPASVVAYGRAYGTWAINGAGPDKLYTSDSVTVSASTVSLNLIYDPTNGTVSRGDVVRSQKFSAQPGPYAGGGFP